MALFRRKPSPQQESAQALAARGVAGEATVVALREGGERRGCDTRACEVTVDIALPGRGPLRTTQTQFLSRYQRCGLAPGSPVRVVYDRGRPALFLVLGHARIRSEIADRELMVVPPAPAAGGAAHGAG